MGFFLIKSFRDCFAPLRQVDPLNFSEVVTRTEILRETGSKTFKAYLTCTLPPRGTKQAYLPRCCPTLFLWYLIHDTLGT